MAPTSPEATIASVTCCAWTVPLPIVAAMAGSKPRKAMRLKNAA
jgi:hypothetical protein